MVAGAACLSPFHFSQVFCAMTRETVISYQRKRRLSAAIDASACTSVPGSFSARTLAARKWAVFTHKGYLRDIPKSYEFIFGAWFPKSEWQSAPAEHFEYRGPDYKGDFLDSLTEIWIPLLEGAAKR